MLFVGVGFEFVCLKKFIGVIDGNFGVYIEMLVKVGYVVVEKVFVGKKL